MSKQILANGFLLLLLVTSVGICIAQTPKKETKKTNILEGSEIDAAGKTFKQHGDEGKKYANRKILRQRSALSVGIPSVLNKIPGKNYLIIIETYSNDPESLNLKKDIKEYLQKQSYTNIKANITAYFTEECKYKPCSVMILDNPQAFDIFIAPCYEAYAK